MWTLHNRGLFVAKLNSHTKNGVKKEHEKSNSPILSGSSHESRCWKTWANRRQWKLSCDWHSYLDLPVCLFRFAYLYLDLRISIYICVFVFQLRLEYLYLYLRICWNWYEKREQDATRQTFELWLLGWAASRCCIVTVVKKNKLRPFFSTTHFHTPHTNGIDREEKKIVPTKIFFVWPRKCSHFGQNLI